MERTLTNSRWHALVMVAGGVLLSTMDSSMINVALPEIMLHFNVAMSQVQLVVLVYLMVITSSLVVWGRVADRFGPIRIYLAGITIFVLGALGCSISPEFHVLIGCRLLQALGAAMIMAAGPAILKLTSPAASLGGTLGLVGIATSCGLMSGPIISGMLLQYVSWRAIFVISVPLAAMIFLLGCKKLLDMKGKNSLLGTKNHETADWKGALTWVLLVGCYVLLLTDNDFINSWFLLIFLLIFLVTFLVIETHASSPILPLSLLRKRYYWTGAAAASLSFAALFMVIILIPFFLKLVRVFEPSEIGLIMMAVPVSLVIVSPFSGWLYDRLGSARVISTTGLLLSCSSVFLLSRVSADTSSSTLFLILVVLGAGQSVFLSPNSASVLTRVEDRFAGITSGILATARNFGMLTGAGVATGAFSYFFEKHSHGASLNTFMANSQLHINAFIHAQQQTMTIALMLLIAGVICSLLRS
ncbi:MFS transporter [Desulfosediminicola sp.]|uniref:MFS transporter n=1 Tax=Desulfosediminicola sp. TaxID=2886825 RepID=UPI003AF1EF6A